VAALPVPGEHPGPESREAYAIQVTPGGVNVEGRSSAALYYAAQTLHQLVDGQGGPRPFLRWRSTIDPRFLIAGS